ncbi:tetratricopeptide repeat protein [Nubsella zeaxanthinifaciens]|uniref:tetratricopeptide repeat protein n=1 Tax=Nubsella zeaxanthinifaciens TaxID=392412 RepID=UPI000DE50091|nr:hypothetical protein [Nubsella zeaxanthinifaciens]
MKLLTITTLSFALISLFSCQQDKHDKVFETFNAGVSLSLESLEEQNKGNFEKSMSLNKQSIDKFKETLKLDSTHAMVRSALGHGLYIDKQFQDAIYWFDQANKVTGDAAANYREMGLCKINLGQIKEGKSDIDRAFSLDTTDEIRELTIQDLTDIGKLGFQYGDSYVQNGESDKGKGYKTFSIGVLMLAFEYSRSRKDIALMISEYASRLGDKSTAARYRALGGK